MKSGGTNLLAVRNAEMFEKREGSLAQSLTMWIEEHENEVSHVGAQFQSSVEVEVVSGKRDGNGTF